MYQINSYLSSVGVEGIFCEIRKYLWLGNFLNLNPSCTINNKNNKDSYRCITLFRTLFKIYEMVLLNRLDKYTERRGFFSKMQFGFQEAVDCIEASFFTLETTNHMLERGSKIFSCFLDVRKAFDTVWVDGLLYKLFTELGINGKCGLQLKTCTRI